MAYVRKRLPFLDRLWAKIEPEPMSGCWLWTAAVNPKGYGQAKYQGRNQPAHRITWEVLGGNSSTLGLTLDRLCKVRCCVNPAHLRELPLRDNILIGNGPCAVNARKIHCIHGHSYWAHRLRHGKPVRVCKVCESCHQREKRRRRKIAARDVSMHP